MTATSAQKQVVVPASTVIVFRDGARGAPEILLVQRSSTLSFAAAATVFPGGKVDPSDTDLSSRLLDLDADDAAARIAGIREVIEETGLVLGVRQRTSADAASAARIMLARNGHLAPVLAHFGWTLDTEQLVPFAHWLPTFKPGRIFDTRFYLANLGSGQVNLSPDLGENIRLFWMSARDALAQIERGEINAIYPTRRNLERIAQFESFTDAVAHARATPLQTISPWIEQHEGVEMLRIRDDAGYPVTSAPLSQIHVE